MIAGPVRAQQAAEPATLRGESPQTRKRLAEAEQKVLGGKAAEAIEDLQRILDEAGDDFISLDGKQHRAARWIAHQILSKLPADVLRSYQDRIEEPARKLLEAGRRDREPRPLQQLLDRYFVSRPGEEALLLLGDLQFERGQFRFAELNWRRLLPDADADVVWPGAKSDPAAIRARLILAAIFQGETQRASDELASFAKRHPEAKGTLAGGTGLYTETLKKWLAKPLPPAAGSDRAWSTFGGDAGRSGRLQGPLPVRWPSRPAWTATIDKVAPFPRPPARPPFGHPVIMNGWVYISDGQRIEAFNLTTGQESLLQSGQASEGTSCPSLTAANGRLYARLGSPIIRPPDPAMMHETAIVCYAPAPRPARDGPPLRERWRLAPPAGEGRTAVWEGAPLVANGRLWAAFSRFEGGRISYSVACYDPADADIAPERPAWVAEVCDTPLHSALDSQARSHADLLTFAGRNVVFNSNAGAVIALDAESGRRAWGYGYPRAARRIGTGMHAPNPAPAVFSGGRVFAAPTDADRAFALDAETGQELWESGPIEVGRILGVVRNRVLITSTGPVSGIRGLSVVNGSYRRPDGWIQATGLLTYGQGLASDDAILWPSRAGLYFLDPESGKPIAPPLATPGSEANFFGNLAYADGWLVVVMPREIWAYRTDAPAFTTSPEDSRRSFEETIGRAERELQEGNVATARESLLAFAGSANPKPLRAWAAARALPLMNEVPPPFDELRSEWLFTASGELVTLGTLLDRRAGKPPAARSEPGPPSLPADRKPLDAPGLDADTHIAATLRLPAGSTPLQPIPGGPTRRLFISSRELLAISLSNETKTAFEAADVFTHAADLSEGFVAAGPLCVAVYGADRTPRWVFRVPETEPLPSASRVIRTAPLPPPELSSFALAGDWLIARLGERHLLALDLKSRTVAWLLGSHGRSRYEPHLFEYEPAFAPRFFVSDRLLVVQLTDGRRWFVQLSTGRVWGEHGATLDEVPDGYGTRTSGVAWKSPPVDVDGNLLAFPDGPGLVRFSTGTSGKSKAVYRLNGDSSLAGEPPQVRRSGDAVFVSVRRNYGVELDRVDPTDGSSVWSGSVFLDTGSIDLDAADADPQRIIVPANRTLAAFGLDDGKLAWEAKLPAAGRWQVRAGRRAVITWPAEALAEETDSLPRLGRSFLREPQPWRLPWLAAAWHDSWNDRTVPVLLFDPESGKHLKTITIPAAGPAIRAHLDGELAVLATGDRVVWLR